MRSKRFDRMSPKEWQKREKVTDRESVRDRKRDIDCSLSDNLLLNYVSYVRSSILLQQKHTQKMGCHSFSWIWLQWMSSVLISFVRCRYLSQFKWFHLKSHLKDISFWFIFLFPLSLLIQCMGYWSISIVLIRYDS